MLIRCVRTCNYRTLEDVEIRFPGYYTALCGRNDSGKSNVLRTLRLLMSSRHPFAQRPDLSFDDDLTKWIAPQADTRIAIEFEIEIEGDRDAGLYSFVTKQLALEEPSDPLRVSLILARQQGATRTEYSVTVDERTFQGLDAEEVLAKIRKTACVLLHDSSGHFADYYFWPQHEGVVRDLAGEDKKALDKARSGLDRSLKRIARSHREELAELMGRLEDRYKVGVSLEQLNLGMVPYSITLGDTKVEVPLSDWGSGTRNRTNILQILFRAKQISEAPTHADKITPVLIVEEPESFLHPSAQAKFADVLQDVSEEFRVQVIATTHSPHMLSHRNPMSNVLLERQTHRKALRKTRVVSADDADWTRPFAEALGISGDTFGPWKSAVFPSGDTILLVEGKRDCDYIELLRDSSHGTKRLKYTGEVFPYGGCGNLENTVLLRFLLDKYKRMLVSFDLDAERRLKPKFESLGLKPERDYLPVGVRKSGRQRIEGLLPERIRSAVYGDNVDLVEEAADKTDKTKQRSAENRLKDALLERFRADAKPGDDFAEFYKLARKIEKALCE